MIALRRFWPDSLKGQVLLALAAALLLAQGISAVLLYKAQAEYHEEQLVHGLAMRVTMATRHDDGRPRDLAGPEGLHHEPRGDMPRGLSPELTANFFPAAVDHTERDIGNQLTQLLTEQEIPIVQLVVVERPISADPVWQARINDRFSMMGKHHPPRPDQVLIAAVQRQAGGPWLLVRISVPPRDPWLLATLIAQTLFIYALLVSAMAVILRRIVRPLAELTDRVEHFAETREDGGQLAPQGPDDVRRLIEAHNAMEQRIIALIKEKDVMLGAIGHDLKTPLTALRVRIESVEDDAERGKMAQTIEDIVRSLDDILSLARVGRPSDPVEQTELSALVASIVEEYEDMGDDVVLDETSRMVLPVRPTWMRRALRNLIGNALRYSGSAVVNMTRETTEGRAWAVIRITDPGKGIPEGQIERMFEPFTRGEPSRNTSTGGAGLGLTLARAIAEQHGGQLTLANRIDGTGAIVGLLATLRLPLPV